MSAVVHSEFFVCHKGEERGPLSFEEFRDGWVSGEFDEETLLWIEGLADWILPDQRLASTHARIAAGKVSHRAGSTGFAERTFPCWELVVLDQGPDMFGRDWAARWKECGGRFYGVDHRMIACKGDPIWHELGSVDRYQDALGIPHAPFAFAAGLITREIDRHEAGALGLITD